MYKLILLMTSVSLFLACGNPESTKIDDPIHFPNRTGVQAQIDPALTFKTAPEIVPSKSLKDDRPWSTVKFFGQSISSDFDFENAVQESKNHQVTKLSNELTIQSPDGFHVISQSLQQDGSWLRQAHMGADELTPNTCPKDSQSNYCKTKVSDSDLAQFSKISLTKNHVLWSRNNMQNARILLQETTLDPQAQGTELHRVCNGAAGKEFLPNNVNGIRDLFSSMKNELGLNPLDQELFSCTFVELDSAAAKNIHWSVYGVYFTNGSKNYELIVYAPVGSRFNPFTDKSS